MVVYKGANQSSMLDLNILGPEEGRLWLVSTLLWMLSTDRNNNHFITELSHEIMRGVQYYDVKGTTPIRTPRTEKISTQHANCTLGHF